MATDRLGGVALYFIKHPLSEGRIRHFPVKIVTPFATTGLIPRKMNRSLALLGIAKPCPTKFEKAGQNAE